MEIAEAELTLKDAKLMADLSIRHVKKGFIETGYYLGLIRNRRLWEAEYSSFQEFLDTNYRKDRSWASRCISLYEQFGCSGGMKGLPRLAEPYEDYSVSQLIEMLSMTEEQRKQVAPDMTVRQIRELKPKREREAPEDISAGEMPGETEEEPEEEQIPGQMNVQDYPGIVATSQPAEPGDTMEEPEADVKDSGQQEKGAPAEPQPRETGKAMPEAPVPDGPENGTEALESVTEIPESVTEIPENVTEDLETGSECRNAEQETGESDTDKEFTTVSEAVREMPAAYDRGILEEMIRRATEEMDIMWDHWAEHMPDLYTKHAMQIRAYRNLLDEHEGKQAAGGEPEEEPVRDPVQPELPLLKNDSQRKEWLRNYRNWGLWYEDRNIGAKYYRYIFDNGAVLVVDEYQCDTYEGGAEYTASFLHLTGGPEPARHPNQGEHKWPYRKRYSRYPDSETELVEFLKALQQKGERKK